MAENRIPTVTIDSWDGLHSTVCQDETAQARLLADAVGGAERVYVCGGGETLRQLLQSGATPRDAGLRRVLKQAAGNL